MQIWLFWDREWCWVLQYNRDLPSGSHRPLRLHSCNPVVMLAFHNQASWCHNRKTWVFFPILKHGWEFWHLLIKVSTIKSRTWGKPADPAEETELWSRPEVDQLMTRDIRHIFKWAVWSVMNEIPLWSMTEPMFLWDHFKPRIKEPKLNVFSLAVEHSPQNQIHSPKY